MKTTRAKPSALPDRLDGELRAQLQHLAAMPDELIDLSDPDAPEVTDWTGALRGRFYRPA